MHILRILGSFFSPISHPFSDSAVVSGAHAHCFQKRSLASRILSQTRRRLRNPILLAKLALLGALFLTSLAAAAFSYNYAAKSSGARVRVLSTTFRVSVPAMDRAAYTQFAAAFLPYPHTNSSQSEYGPAHARSVILNQSTSLNTTAPQFWSELNSALNAESWPRPAFIIYFSGTHCVVVDENGSRSLCADRTSPRALVMLTYGLSPRMDDLVSRTISKAWSRSSPSGVARVQQSCSLAPLWENTYTLCSTAKLLCLFLFAILGVRVFQIGEEFVATPSCEVPASAFSPKTSDCDSLLTDGEKDHCSPSFLGLPLYLVFECCVVLASLPFVVQYLVRATIWTRACRCYFMSQHPLVFHLVARVRWPGIILQYLFGTLSLSQLILSSSCMLIIRLWLGAGMRRKIVRKRILILTQLRTEMENRMKLEVEERRRSYTGC